MPRKDLPVILMQITPLSCQSCPEEVELAINQAIGRTYRYNFRLAIGVFVALPLALICLAGMVVGLGLQNPIVVVRCWAGLMTLLLTLTSFTTLMSYYDSRRAWLERELEAYRQTGDLDKVLAWHLNVTYTDE